ncbi:MAG: site-specific DNA-methyltransferase [Sphingobacteriales bacterium]|nr:site-specific DNA-methyltransferase [Sphingobacteriales bacterium]
MQDLPDQCVDMVLCDLPYGLSDNPWDQVIDLDQLWQQYSRVVKSNGVIALTSSGAFTGKLIMSNLQDFKYKIVWIKSRSTNFLNANKQPLRRHEDICIFYKRQPFYAPQMIPGKPYHRGLRSEQQTGCYGQYKPNNSSSPDGYRYPYDIVWYEGDEIDDWFYCKTCDHEKEKSFHPTQKPVALGQYLIRSYSKEGDLILDNACGSGSFLVAAAIENRQFIGIELNRNTFYKKSQPIDFAEVARERVKKAMCSGLFNKI